MRPDEFSNHPETSLEPSDNDNHPLKKSLSDDGSRQERTPSTTTTIVEAWSDNEDAASVSSDATSDDNTSSADQALTKLIQGIKKEIENVNQSLTQVLEKNQHRKNTLLEQLQTSKTNLDEAQKNSQKIGQQYLLFESNEQKNARIQLENAQRNYTNLENKLNKIREPEKSLISMRKKLEKQLADCLKQEEERKTGKPTSFQMSNKPNTTPIVSLYETELIEHESALANLVQLRQDWENQEPTRHAIHQKQTLLQSEIDKLQSNYVFALEVLKQNTDDVEQNKDLLLHYQNELQAQNNAYQARYSLYKWIVHLFGRQLIEEIQIAKIERDINQVLTKNQALEQTITSLSNDIESYQKHIEQDKHELQALTLKLNQMLQKPNVKDMQALEEKITDRKNILAQARDIITASQESSFFDLFKEQESNDIVAVKQALIAFLEAPTVGSLSILNHTIAEYPQHVKNHKIMQFLDKAKIAYPGISTLKIEPLDERFNINTQDIQALIKKQEKNREKLASLQKRHEFLSNDISSTQEALLQKEEAIQINKLALSTAYRLLDVAKQMKKAHASGNKTEHLEAVAKSLSLESQIREIQQSLPQAEVQSVRAARRNTQANTTPSTGIHDKLQWVEDERIVTLDRAYQNQKTNLEHLEQKIQLLKANDSQLEQEIAELKSGQISDEIKPKIHDLIQRLDATSLYLDHAVKTALMSFLTAPTRGCLNELEEAMESTPHYLVNTKLMPFIQEAGEFYPIITQTHQAILEKNKSTPAQTSIFEQGLHFMAKNIPLVQPGKDLDASDSSSLKKGRS